MAWDGDTLSRSNALPDVHTWKEKEWAPDLVPLSEEITEEVFFSEILPISRVNVEVLVPELKKRGILLDDSIMSSLDPPMGRIDELHYVMYRLGKKDNGLQIFYRCLRETQDECPEHGWVADRIERKGIIGTTLLQH